MYCIELVCIRLRGCVVFSAEVGVRGVWGGECVWGVVGCVVGGWVPSGPRLRRLKALMLVSVALEAAIVCVRRRDEGGEGEDEMEGREWVRVRMCQQRGY